MGDQSVRSGCGTSVIVDSHRKSTKFAFLAPRNQEANKLSLQLINNNTYQDKCNCKNKFHLNDLLLHA